MPTFLAVYRGPTIRDARLIDVSVDPSVIASAARGILAASRRGATDPAIEGIDAARRKAIKVVLHEAETNASS